MSRWRIGQNKFHMLAFAGGSTDRPSLQTPSIHPHQHLWNLHLQIIEMYRFQASPDACYRL